MKKLVIKGRTVSPGDAVGVAIVSKSPIPISGPAIDAQTGSFRWRGHELDGVCIKDRILVAPAALGSSGGDWALYALRAVYDTAPKGIVCSRVDLFTTAGTILGGIPAMDRLQLQPSEAIETGDLVRIDSQKGCVEVLKRQKGEDATPDREKAAGHGASLTPVPFSLTDEEERMLGGGMGEGAKICMEFLVNYGRALDARRMVKIQGAHAAACGYIVAGEGALRYLERLARKGAKAMVPSTLNPISVDLKRWKSVMRLPEEIYRKQLRLNRAFKKLGFVPSYTCSPYWTSAAPKLGEHVVWGEHNAVCYANSVLGARTNFEAHSVAFPAALTGRIPEYGLHIKVNRKVQAIVRVDTELQDPLDWRCLGLHVGKNLIDKIPLFMGLPNMITNRQFRDLCSTMGPPYAKIPMFHVLGVTPEAPDLKSAFHGKTSSDLETLQVGKHQILEAHDMLNKRGEGKVDLVMMGCPFYCIEDIKEVADLLRGKKIHSDVHLWIWTDEATRTVGERMGVISDIEEAGGFVLTDTCSVAGAIDMCDYRFRNVMTDSLKASAYFLKSGKFSPSVGGMEECIETAINGRMKRKKVH